MIKTGFKGLDNFIDLNKAGVTVLTGIDFANMLSGDIANNICLGQEYDVLEVVSPKKEYLIKRLNPISQKLNCPIIIVAGIDLKKQYNNKFKCLTPKELDNIDKINKYVNNYIVLNYTNENGIFNLDIYNNKEKTGTCKLRYNYDIRKFEEVKNGFYAK